MRFFVVCAFVLLMMCLPGSGKGQFARIDFENITIKDGLPSNKINCIAKDSLGFFWYGTTLGLVRSDGHRFDIWRHHPLDSLSIPDSDIRLIKVDQNNIVWVLTWNGDLFAYDAYKHFKERIRPILFLEDNGKVDMIGAFENGDDGYTYALSKRGKFYRIDRSTMTADEMTIRSMDQSMPNNPRASILIDNVFWVGAENGLYKIDLLEHEIGKIDISTFARPESSSPEGIERMVRYDENSIMLTGLRSTFSFDGLLVFDFRKDSLYQVRGRIHDKFNIDRFPIHKIWAAGNKKFFFLPFGETPFYYDFNAKVGDTIEVDDKKQKLSTISINDMYLESSGRITIGSNQGIFIHEPFSYLFKEVLPYVDRNMYPNRNFNVHHDLKKDQLYIATNEMVLVYDHALEKVVYETYYPDEPNFRNREKVPEIIELSDDRLMIISNRVYIYDFQTRKLRPINIKGENGDAVYRNRFPRTSVPGAPEEHFVIKDGYLLYIKAGSTPEIHGERLLRSNGNQWNPAAKGAGMDRGETLWVSTSTSINKIDNVEKPMAEEIKWNLDSTIRIYDILVDGQDVIWVATRDHGLQRCMSVSKDSLFCETFDLRHGLAANRIYNLQEDQFNTIWMTTLYGVSSFDKQEASFINYGNNHGINFPHFMRPGKGRNKHGELFFSEGIGIIRFDPARFQNKSDPPSVYISQFSIDDQPVCSFWADTTITLKWWQRSFSFTISALNHTHAYMNKYWYKLENFHNDWLRTDHDNLTINFNRMEAGEYAFRARAANHENTVNEKGITIRLQLLPPFWETWWFRLACILLVILLIRLYVQYQLGKARELEMKLIRKEIETQTEERKRIAQDLHDDIGAQLSTLKMYVSAFNKDRENNADIQEISEETQQMISRTIRDMRHIITELSPQALATYGYTAAINEFVYYLKKSTDIDIVMDVSHFDSKLGKNEEAALYRITQELFNNTLKHAQAKQIVFKIVDKGAESIFHYSEDGIGFNQEQVTIGRGLFSIASRVKFLSGKMQVYTEPGKGFSIMITFPNTGA